MGASQSEGVEIDQGCPIGRIGLFYSTVKTISVSELKTHLSAQLRAIKKGSRLLITERGRPVAELGPPTSAPEQRLAELQATGVVRIGRRQLSADFWERPRPRDAGASALEALLEERRESR